MYIKHKCTQSSYLLHHTLSPKLGIWVLMYETWAVILIRSMQWTISPFFLTKVVWVLGTHFCSYPYISDSFGFPINLYYWLFLLLFVFLFLFQGPSFATNWRDVIVRLVWFSCYATWCLGSVCWKGMSKNCCRRISKFTQMLSFSWIYKLGSTSKVTIHRDEFL